MVLRRHGDLQHHAVVGGGVLHCLPGGVLRRGEDGPGSHRVTGGAVYRRQGDRARRRQGVLGQGRQGAAAADGGVHVPVGDGGHLIGGGAGRLGGDSQPLEQQRRAHGHRRHSRAGHPGLDRQGPFPLRFPLVSGDHPRPLLFFHGSDFLSWVLSAPLAELQPVAQGLLQTRGQGHGLEGAALRAFKFGEQPHQGGPLGLVHRAVGLDHVPLRPLDEPFRLLLGAADTPRQGPGPHPADDVGQVHRPPVQGHGPQLLQAQPVLRRQLGRGQPFPVPVGLYAPQVQPQDLLPHQLQEAASRGRLGLPAPGQGPLPAGEQQGHRHGAVHGHLPAQEPGPSQVLPHQFFQGLGFSFSQVKIELLFQDAFLPTAKLRSLSLPPQCTRPP